MLPFFLSSYNTGLLSLALIYAMAAMGQTVLTGTANLPSLGNSSFMLIGAWVSASFASDLHLPFLVAALLAVAVAGLVGILVGLPALRISGLYLAIATIALVFVAQEVLGQVDIIAGRSGPTVTGPGWLSADRGLFYSSLLLSAVITLLLWNLTRSRVGRAWLALRGSEAAATASGISATRYKTLAFGVSASVCAIAGVMIAQYNAGVSTAAFGLPVSLSLIAMAVIGGLGSLPGAYVGAFLITLLPNILGAFPATIGSFQVHNASTLISALLLVVVLAFLPGGLWSVVDRGLNRANRKPST